MDVDHRGVLPELKFWKPCGTALQATPDPSRIRHELMKLVRMGRRLHELSVCMKVYIMNSVRLEVI